MCGGISNCGRLNYGCGGSGMHYDQPSGCRGIRIAYGSCGSSMHNDDFADDYNQSGNNHRGFRLKSYGHSCGGFSGNNCGSAPMNSCGGVRVTPVNKRRNQNINSIDYEELRKYINSGVYGCCVSKHDTIKGTTFEVINYQTGKLTSMDSNTIMMLRGRNIRIHALSVRVNDGMITFSSDYARKILEKTGLSVMFNLG